MRLTNGITRGELAFVLQEAALEAEGLIAGNISRHRVVTLNSAMQGVSTLSQELWGDINRLVQEGVYAASELAADHQLLREVAMGMPDGLIRQYSDRMYFNALQSANDIVSRHTNGFTLSQRVYRNSQASVLTVGKIVDRGLALQMSAREIAAGVRSHISPTTPGGVSYAANRLARTEINNAHHDTTIRTTKNRPWVTGYKWMLSGSHPKTDICDQYAHRGSFSKLDVPSKPHPQCFCFIVVEQESHEEFMKKLKNEDYDGFLESEGVPERERARFRLGDEDAFESRRIEIFKEIRATQGRTPSKAEVRRIMRSEGLKTPRSIKSASKPEPRPAARPARSVRTVRAPEPRRPAPRSTPKVEPDVDVDTRLSSNIKDAGITDEDRIDQIVELNRTVKDRYGIGFDSVEKVNPSFIGEDFESVMAYMRNGNVLGVSPKRMTNKNALRDMKTGWGAQGTGTVSDVIVHEYGHMLMEGGFKSGMQQATLRADTAARKLFETTGDYAQAKRNISRYGSTERHEAMAELFMNYHMGGASRPDWVVTWGEEFHRALGLDSTPLRDLLKVGGS